MGLQVGFFGEVNAVADVIEGVNVYTRIRQQGISHGVGGNHLEIACFIDFIGEIAGGNFLRKISEFAFSIRKVV
jgi:hypothetical protein